MQPGWRIVRLADHPAACDPLVRLMQTAWPDYYGEDGPGDAGADLLERSRIADLPYGIAAFASDGDVIGTAALGKHSYGSRPDESPWLIGLLVAPEWRGRGVGSALVATLETYAAAQRCRAVYCTTESGVRLLTRRGWRVIRDTEDGTNRILTIGMSQS